MKRQRQMPYKVARGTYQPHKGVNKSEHRYRAELALGKPLPYGVVVHHVDGNPGNNENSNLVICEDRAYHSLLHSRTEALFKSREIPFSGHSKTWRKPRKKITEALYVRIEPRLLAELQALAERQDRSVAAVVRMAIRTFMAKETEK